MRRLILAFACLLCVPAFALADSVHFDPVDRDGVTATVVNNGAGKRLLFQGGHLDLNSERARAIAAQLAPPVDTDGDGVPDFRVGRQVPERGRLPTGWLQPAAPGEAVRQRPR